MCTRTSTSAISRNDLLPEILKYEKGGAKHLQTRVDFLENSKMENILVFRFSLFLFIALKSTENRTAVIVIHVSCCVSKVIATKKQK